MLRKTSQLNRSDSDIEEQTVMLASHLVEELGFFGASQFIDERIDAAVGPDQIGIACAWMLVADAIHDLTSTTRH